MNNLALSDEILLKIEKPVRYIGNEVNMVRKDPEGKIRFAMCFPCVRNRHVPSWDEDYLRSNEPQG